MPLTTAAIRPLIGAKNGFKQIVAIQSKGFIQVNKRTPLNLECRSLAVARDRCCDTSSNDNYIKFYHNNGYRYTWFNNLVEVLIDGQIINAVMVNQKNICRD